MPEGEDWTRVLFLAAFVLIGLLKWVFEAVAERREAKRAAKEGRSIPGHTQVDTADEELDWEPPKADPVPPPPLPPEPTRGRRARDAEPTPEPRIPRQLQRYLEALGGGGPEDTATAPPPVPTATVTPSARDRRPTTAPRKPAPTLALKRPTRRRSPSSDAVRRMLESTSSTRTAFVLREVLGPPKGLQPDHPAPNL